MFSFFKINDPYRLIAIFILAFAIKLPFILGQCSYYEMQEWLLIGESLQNKSMYQDVFDSTAPLAAFTYWLIVVVAGKSVTALHILGSLLLVVQAVIFNTLTIKNKVYEQNTYLPAFAFLIIASTHYSFSVFSPVQLGITFVLLAFSQLLSHVEFRAKRDEQIMSIGLLIGISGLFYLPLILFLPIVVLILLIFTNTLSRRYFILIVSGMTPVIISICYYWVTQNSIGFYYSNFLDHELSFSFDSYRSIWVNYPLLLPIVFFWVLGLVTLPQQRRLNNYQNRLAQLFFAIGVLTIGIIGFGSFSISSSVILLIPVAAYFTTHFILLIKRPLKELGVSILFIGSICFVNYETEFGFLGWPGKTYISPEINPELVQTIDGKRIWVIGDFPSLYYQAKLGTTFYNWSLSESALSNLDYYDNVVAIRRSIDLFEPEVVLDYELKFRKIITAIPELKNIYKQDRPFVWTRK